MTSSTTCTYSRSTLLSGLLCANLLLSSLVVSAAAEQPGGSVRGRRFVEEEAGAEVCIEVETTCVIQNENDSYINCEDFKFEPSLDASNCVRHAIISGSITNVFDSTVVVSYHVDTEGETFNITDQGDTVELGAYGKEVILCHKEGSEEVPIFDLFLHSAWKHESSNSPIECEAMHEKLVLTLPDEITTDPTPPTQCNLEAKLGYPFNDPDESPYMGYSSEWLMVQIMGAAENDENTTCYSTEETEWCSYNNSGGYDSAYLGNVDDYYTDWAAIDDQLYNETFTLTDIGGLTLNFTVSHWFWEKDYYSQYEVWSDHMLASVLTINNTVTGKPLNPEEGWSHPVDMNQKTHIEEENGSYVINPEYSGDFFVLVTCSEDCICSAFNYTVL